MQIKSKFDEGRAILVVFRDQVQMNKFALDVQSRKIENPHWKPPLQLSDMLSESERESVVIKAARPYAVTLMTRAYGRGTDFACRDSGLVKNGGVHVILTVRQCNIGIVWCFLLHYSQHAVPSMPLCEGATYTMQLNQLVVPVWCCSLFLMTRAKRSK